MVQTISAMIRNMICGVCDELYAVDSEPKPGSELVNPPTVFFRD